MSEPASDLVEITPEQVAQEIKSLREARKRIREALSLMIRYGGIDGDHHRRWTIVEAIKLLSGSDYEALVKYAKDGEDGPETYDWDEGIPP